MKVTRLTKAVFFIAAAVGLTHGIFGIYWAFGGNWLLDTIGNIAASEDGQVRAFFTILGSAKTLGALAPLLLLRPHPPLQRTIRIISWIGAIFLTMLGIATIVIGAAELAAEPSSAESYGLLWTTLFWHPMFLIWGIALLTALITAKHNRSSPNAPSEEATTKAKLLKDDDLEHAGA